MAWWGSMLAAHKAGGVEPRSQYPCKSQAQLCGLVIPVLWEVGTGRSSELVGCQLSSTFCERQDT